MIKVYRPDTSPSYLRTEKMNSSFKRMKDFFKEPLVNRIQKRYEFDTKFYSMLKKDLYKIFQGKCVYCEKPIEPREADVESFRPRKEAKNIDDKISDDHYWWLFYEWRNYYLSCSHCNRFKGTWFPVKGKRTKIGAKYESVIKENYLLLDPCIDEGHLHIEVLENGTARGLTERGNLTIEILKLNRDELVYKRKREWRRTQNLIISNVFRIGVGQSIRLRLHRKGLLFIKSLFADNAEMPFAGTSRWALLHFCWEHPEGALLLVEFLKKQGIRSDFFAFFELQWKKRGKKGAMASLTGKYIASRTGRVLKTIARRTELQVLIDKIEVRNFKAIEELALKFPNPKSITTKTKKINEPWLMMLGENGVGKSSILQAIALVLMGRANLAKRELTSRDVLRHGSTEGYVRIFQHGSDKPYSIEYSDRDIKIQSNVGTPPLNLLGYGSTRLFPTPAHLPEQNRGKARVKNLFDPHVPLVDPGQWLVNLFHGKGKAETLQFGRIAKAVKDLLLMGNDEELDIREGKAVLTRENGFERTLDMLSEGYRSVLSVAVDIMHAINKTETSMETAQGLVLLDEIGTHLHPRWRMTVVKQFRKVFPKMQFIVTTHDPLCLRGMEKNEVVVLRKTPDQRVFAVKDLPDHSGMNAEQLLGSEFFGLSSTYDSEVEEQFNDYYLLLSKAKRTAAEEKKLKSLQSFVQKINKVGNNRYEQRKHEIIQQEIAESNFDPQKTKIILQKETLDKIREIWK